MAHRLNRRQRRQAEIRELAEALALQDVWREQRNRARIATTVTENAARAESQTLLEVWQARENRGARFAEQARLRAKARKRRRRLRRIG